MGNKDPQHAGGWGEVTENPEFQPWRSFKPEKSSAPHAWVQFKGTNLCADFACPCGGGHIDAEFAYFVRCACGKVYELAGFLEAREISPEEAENEVAIVDVK